MLNIIITAVFKLIEIIGKILITPIFTVLSPILNALGFSQFANGILNFVDYSLTYVDFFIDIFHIPRVALVIVLGLGATILTFNIALITFSLVTNIYSYIKNGAPIKQPDTK